jgi:hypothetical protein
MSWIETVSLGNVSVAMELRIAAGEAWDLQNESSSM